MITSLVPGLFGDAVIKYSNFSCSLQFLTEFQLKIYLLPTVVNTVWHIHAVTTDNHRKHQINQEWSLENEAGDFVCFCYGQSYEWINPSRPYPWWWRNMSASVTVRLTDVFLVFLEQRRSSVTHKNKLHHILVTQVFVSGSNHCCFGLFVWFVNSRK